MYFQWNDRSLCETGFTFSRQGQEFTSTYAVQSSDSCDVLHAPTSVFDDLNTAQMLNKAQVGSFQRYCIQAENPIGCDSDGSYKSNSTLGCATLQINWESALNGVIRGPDGTGSIPVPEVTIVWSFASNSKARGTGETNANGQFVDQTGAIGFNLQVSPFLFEDKTGDERLACVIYS